MVVAVLGSQNHTQTPKHTHTPKHTQTRTHTMLTSDEVQWVRNEERLFNQGLFPMLAAKVAQAEAEAEAEAEARLRAATATEEVFSRLLAQLFAVRTAPRRA